MILLDADVLLVDLRYTSDVRFPKVQYGLSVFPDLDASPQYAGCTVGELVAQMARKMALGDAVQAVQIALYVPTAACLLTWNAKHFQGKVSIPVLTPAGGCRATLPRNLSAAAAALSRSARLVPVHELFFSALNRSPSGSAA